MANNKNSPIDFASERNILSFRPNIHYVEPESIDVEPPAPSIVVDTLDDMKQDAENLISDYSNIEAACDEIQRLINNRAANVTIKLNAIQDSHVIAAIQRHLGDPNKTDISFQDYLNCIDEVNSMGEDNLTLVDSNDVQSAASDPFRDQFGSIDFGSGLARPELQSINQSIQPIDLNEFKSDQLNQLFEIFKPLITKLIKDNATGGLL